MTLQQIHSLLQLSSRIDKYTRIPEIRAISNAIVQAAGDAGIRNRPGGYERVVSTVEAALDAAYPHTILHTRLRVWLYQASTLTTRKVA